MKLQAKLTVMFSLLFSIFLIGTGYLFYYQAQVALKKYTLHYLEHICKNLSVGVNNFFRERFISVNSASTSVYIKTRVVEINKNANNSNHLQVMRQICSRLGQLKEEDLHISELFIVNPAGIVIASTDKNQIGKDKSDRDYLKKRMTDITDIYLSPTLGIPTMVAFAPLIDTENKDFLGTILARIEIEELNKMIEKAMGCFGREEIYIVNKDRIFILGSLFEDLPSLVKKLSSSRIEECLNKKDITVGIYPNYKGIKVVGACQYIKDKQWILIVELKTREAFKIIYNLRNWFFGIGAIVCFIIIVLIVKLSKQITRPLFKLIGASNEIAAGNLDISVKAKTGDEIEVLAESFNRMVKDLKKSRQKLEEWGKTSEKKVKEKTKELNEKVEELEKFNKLAIGRELKMIELKKEIEDLREELQGN